MRFIIQKIMNSLTQALLLSVLCFGFLATQVMAKGGKQVFIPIAVGDISTFIPLLASPAQVSISTQENTLGDIHNVSWGAVDDAAYYQIEVIDSEGKKQVFTTTELHYALSGLPLGESSAYILACNNKNQCGGSRSLGSYLTTEKIRFVHADLLGSPVLETDEAGNVLAEFHYKPYGETKEEKQEDVGYTGHLEDVDLGLTYMQARYYDPVVGRFYSNDPVDYLGHLNRGNPVHGFGRYTYANNNPYKYVDPDGEFGIVGALVGVGIEVAFQAATGELSLSGESFGKIALAGVAGLAGAGIASGAAKLASAAKLGTASKAALGVASDATASAVGTKIQGGDVSFQSVTADVVGGKVGKALASSVNKSIPKSTANADRAAQTKGQPNSRGTTRQAIRQGQKADARVNAIRDTAAATTGAGLGSKVTNECTSGASSAC